MSNKSRKDRGLQTQRLVAARWKQDGWPYAESVGSGSPGRDMTGTPGIGVEIKARRDTDLTGWLRQTKRNAHADVPVLIVRPDGYGPASIDDWPAITTHGVMRRLLRQAGYGDPLPRDTGE